MTNTRTTDVEATVNQIKALERVGADIVRVSVPTMDAAEAFKLIKQRVNVPLVATSTRLSHCAESSGIRRRLSAY
ncbi:flavodoxin-dependent (E)-4-hydroxy-3-methylbut-2-enyl-diphosphate synthase [Escherichia coli]